VATAWSSVSVPFTTGRAASNRSNSLAATKGCVAGQDCDAVGDDVGGAVWGAGVAGIGGVGIGVAEGADVGGAVCVVFDGSLEGCALEICAATGAASAHHMANRATANGTTAHDAMYFCFIMLLCFQFDGDDGFSTRAAG
jgi:hypothetical protein